MKKSLLLTIILLLISVSKLSIASQNLFELQPDANLENIQVIKLGSDQHSSEFLIFIKQHVPLHFHTEHTETVMIISGEAQMVLGDKTMNVSAGDYIRIPAGTHHSVTVTSTAPLKVLSIQAPEFLGKDRVLVN